MLAAFPAFVRLYDILFDGGEDLRGLRWDERRRRLDAIVARLDAGRVDLSPVIEAVDFAALEALRDGERDPAIEGILLKRRNSPYVACRRPAIGTTHERERMCQNEYIPEVSVSLQQRTSHSSHI